MVILKLQSAKLWPIQNSRQHYLLLILGWYHIDEYDSNEKKEKVDQPHG